MNILHRTKKNDAPALPQPGRQFLRAGLVRVLGVLTRIVLARYHPLVVGVTGSVGKSSTKEAIALVLGRSYRVRKSEGNYNNEIGIPLTVLGVQSGGHSVWCWLLVGFRFLRLALLPGRYPEVLVLEMGVDCPGDMDYLLSLVPVSIGVMTTVGSSHIANFGTAGNIAKEKGKLLAHLPADGYAILNADDERVMRLAKKTRAKVITYGFGDGADVRGEHLKVQKNVRLVEGISFKLAYAGTSIPIRLPRVIAPHQVLSALAGAAVGVALKVNPVEIAEALSALEALPGRLRLLPGVQGSFLLDDTYNASPASVRAALLLLRDLAAPRKIIVLGDMLELGENAPSAHRDLLPFIQDCSPVLVVLVGRYVELLGAALCASGYRAEQVVTLQTPDEAALFLKSHIQANDLILIKGSRGMRMEFVTENVLYDPAEANRYLCCQSPDWLVRPFSPPLEWPEKNFYSTID